MLELGQQTSGGGGAPSIQAPPHTPSNGFQTSAMNMNMKPDNNSPSSSSQSPVPPSKLITRGGIPFQPHNLASYHNSPLKTEGPHPGGEIFIFLIFSCRTLVQAALETVFGVGHPRGCLRYLPLGWTHISFVDPIYGYKVEPSPKRRLEPSFVVYGIEVFLNR